MTLKYRFSAFFEDGSDIRQGPDDVSKLDPAKSAFFDVASKTDSPLQVFELCDGRNQFMVDLVDGHFEVNGITVWLQPIATDTIPPGGRYELIYFRDHRHQLTVGDTVQELSHQIAYRIGWKYAAPDGQTFTQCMVVK
jgi:hypothetical protein